MPKYEQTARGYGQRTPQGSNFCAPYGGRLTFFNRSSQVIHQPTCGTHHGLVSAVRLSAAPKALTIALHLSYRWHNQGAHPLTRRESCRLLTRGLLFRGLLSNCLQLCTCRHCVLQFTEHLILLDSLFRSCTTTIDRSSCVPPKSAYNDTRHGLTSKSGHCRECGLGIQHCGLNTSSPSNKDEFTDGANSS